MTIPVTDDPCDDASPCKRYDMTETMDFDGISLDQRQTLALREWQRLSVDGAMPLQKDFRPDRIVRALPAAMLLHVERGSFGIRFHQRLEGRFVVLAFGEGQNRAIDDLYTDEHLFGTIPRYLEAATTGEPAATRCTSPKRDGDPFDYTRLILPFAGENGKVNRLFVVFHFDPVALARLPGPLKVLRQRVPEVRAAAVDPQSMQTLAEPVRKAG